MTQNYNMYPTHRLETPPPASRFHRPWSPEPFDPHPRHSLGDVEGGYYQPGPQRREPSDVSVEALDLADYALTLARQRNEQAAPVFQPYGAYPPSPRPFRSLSSRASASSPPLLSYSPSTANSYSAASSHSAAQPHTNYRAFTLPAPAFPAATQFYPAHNPSSYGSRRGAAEDDPLQTPPLDPDTEIDIAQFPAFTRGWYAQPKEGTDPQQRYAPFGRDPFDPSFPTDEYNGFSTPPLLYASPAVSSYASQSNLHAVPWNADPPDGRPVDADVKEERIRLLERMFGKKGQVNADDEEHAIGSVDAKGRLITEGPTKRLLVRWMQVLLALLAGGSSIYAAAFIKTSSTPPPSGKPPAYVLYVLSVITFLLTTYLFILYPVCCGSRRRKNAASSFTEGPSGMMVLPVQGLPGGKKKKGSKKNDKEGNGVQVNLIVDPGMLNGGHMDDEDDADEEESDSEFSVPGTYSDRSRRSRRKRRAARRRGIFAGLALEAQWKHARKMLKWGMAVDVLMFLAWGAEFVYILIGKRCPSGAFDGWCDAYNVATAAACLSCFAFGFSIFFDVKDVHASQASPRTRTQR